MPRRRPIAVAVTSALLVWAAAGLGGTPCANAQTPAQGTVPGMLTVGTPAPDWRLKGPDGAEHTLRELRGRVVLVDFWATWCFACLKGMSGLQKLQDRYGSRGLTVVGIDVMDKGGDPVGYMRARRYTYQLLLEGESAAEAYGVSVLPTSYLIGPDGKIIHAEVGYEGGPRSDLAALIERNLPSLSQVARTNRSPW